MNVYIRVCVLYVCLCCRVQLFVTPWTIAHQAPVSMGFPRQEYRGGLQCPSLSNLPIPGIEPVSLIPPALTGWFSTTRATWEAVCLCVCVCVCVCVCGKYPLKTMWSTGIHELGPSHVSKKNRIQNNMYFSFCFTYKPLHSETHLHGITTGKRLKSN